MAESTFLRCGFVLLLLAAVRKDVSPSLWRCCSSRL